jgi:hypothetical protein
VKINSGTLGSCCVSVSCADDNCSDRLEVMAVRCCTGYGCVVAVVLAVVNVGEVMEVATCILSIFCVCVP